MNLPMGFAPHLQFYNVRGGLQNVLSIAQCQVPDPLSNHLPLIAHPLDQLIRGLQSNVPCSFAPGTLKNVGRMPCDGLEELQDGTYQGSCPLGVLS